MKKLFFLAVIALLVIGTVSAQGWGFPSPPGSRLGPGSGGRGPGWVNGTGVCWGGSPTLMMRGANGFWGGRR